MQVDRSGQGAVSTMKKIIGKEDLEATMPDPITFNGELPSINQLVHLLAIEAMKRTVGNTSAVAKMLGISRHGLRRFLNIEG
jgi:DNA-binding NtrC family response regulator